MEIRNGRILRVGRFEPPPALTTVDASGAYLLPGFIDLHSDAIEKEIQPRPGGRIPLDVAIAALDRKLAACGITTTFHCLAFGDGRRNPLRTAAEANRIMARIRELEPFLTVRHRFHARHEIQDEEHLPAVTELVRRRAVQVVSFMDHTPGQGQFRRMEDFKAYYGGSESYSEAEVEALIRKRTAARGRVDLGGLRRLARLCRRMGVVVASHDDDTVDKVASVHRMGARVSEFPVTLEAAARASALGMEVLMGAPNILRGASLTHNLSGQAAVDAGCCSLMGSDYLPHAVLQAVFTLEARQPGKLWRWVNLASRHPARALGMIDARGSVAPGQDADLLLVEKTGPVPWVRQTYVGGRRVYSAG